MIESIEQYIPTQVDAVFAMLLEEQDVSPLPVREYKFDAKRDWRADYAWPDPNLKIIIEVEGGIHMYGRHNRPQGFVNDLKKYNAATLQGWRVLRVLPLDLRTEETARMIRAMIDQVKKERQCTQ
jgi:very-short-patch-repair endonuclease